VAETLLALVAPGGAVMDGGTGAAYIPPDPAMPPDSFAALTAALSARYAIERELGHGGMATVYLAVDVKHQRRVAVKILRSELATALGPERFLREVAIAATLNHPHILPVYDSGDADGILYYVMPHVEGESLRRRIDREGQLPIEEAVQITRDLASALEHAHARGVVHPRPATARRAGRRARCGAPARPPESWQGGAPGRRRDRTR